MKLIVLTLIVVALVACAQEKPHTPVELEHMPHHTVFSLLWEYDSNPRAAELEFHDEWIKLDATLWEPEDGVWYLYPKHLTVAAYMDPALIPSSAYEYRYIDRRIELVCKVKEYYAGQILNLAACYLRG